MAKDVEEAHELPVNLTRGRHDTGQNDVSGAQSVGIGFAILCQLGGLELTAGPRGCPSRPTSGK